jgi:hypothetical protein
LACQYQFFAELQPHHFVFFTPVTVRSCHSSVDLPTSEVVIIDHDYTINGVEIFPTVYEVSLTEVYRDFSWIRKWNLGLYTQYLRFYCQYSAASRLAYFECKTLAVRPLKR